MANILPTSSDKQSETSSLRLLVLAPLSNPQDSPSPFPAFLEQLTETAPSQDVTTFAGYTTHPALHLSTKYYQRHVGIWCDEVPPTNPTKSSTDTNQDESKPSEPEVSLSDWTSQMLSTTAREVRDVIGSIILLLPLTQQDLRTVNSSSKLEKWTPYIEAVASLRDAINDDSGRDTTIIVLLQDTTNPPSPSKAETLRTQLEDECMNSYSIFGLDFVLWSPPPKPSTQDSTSSPPIVKTGGQVEALNEFGEKTGFARVREVLEGTDWTADATAQLSDDDDDETGDMDGPVPPYLLEYLTNPKSRHDESKTQENRGGNMDINKGTRANIRSVPGIRASGSSATDNLLERDQNEFQREMLGLKMAMLDVRGTDSGPSSMAGELDVGDLGMRTPMRRGVSGLGKSEGSTSGGEEQQVEQLDGLMERVVAIREVAAGMPGPERERFAKREVNKIMKELG